MKRRSFLFYCGVLKGEKTLKRIVMVVFVLMSVIISANAAEISGIWRFCNGPEFPGAAGSIDIIEGTSDGTGITLNYDFTGGGSYVAAYCDLAVPEALGQVRFRLNKPPDATITVRVADATGQTFQKSVYYDYAGHRDLEFDMQGWTASWGGAADGVLHQPIRTIGILIEKQGLSELAGNISFCRVETLTAKQTESVPLEPKVSPYVVTDFGQDCILARSLGNAFHDGVWHIDFTSAPVAAMSGSLSLFNRPTTLTIRARASAPGARLTVDIGAHFQGFKRIIGVLDGTEQVFKFNLPPDGWEAYGAAHETLHYPLRITRIAIERHECKAEQIEVRLGEITCETAFDHTRAVTLMSQLQDNGVQGTSRSIAVSCSGWNLLDKALDGMLSLEVKNWDGEIVHKEDMPLSLPDSGKRESVTCQFDVPKSLRYIETAFRFVSPGQQDAQALSTFTAPLREASYMELLPKPVSGLQPESPWGMGVYLYRNAYTPEGLAEMERVAALAEEAGVKWSREEFQLSRIETAPGVYDFSFYDDLMAAAHRHSISVYALLAYWSPFAEPYTEEGIDAFCNLTRAAVRHFKDRVKHWEIYNEPNIFFWEGPKELYPVLLERCYKIIKEEDPDAEVLGISTAGIDRGFIKQVVDAGAPFDALTVHPYRSQFIERNFMRELERVSFMVDKRPVWITEMGWSTQIGEGGKTEREQAQLLARAYMSAIAAGVRSMGWYNFRDDGTDPFYNEVNFGVLRRDLTPKAAYRALATVCRVLAVSDDTYPRPMKKSIGEDGIYALAAGRNTSIWSPNGDVDVTLTSDVSDPIMINLMGEPIEYVRETGIASPPLKGCRSTRDLAAPANTSVLVAHLEKGDPVFVLDSTVSIIRVDAVAEVDVLLF